MISAPALLEVDAMMQHVVDQVGGIPPALAGYLAELNADLANHHRKSVIKNHRFAAGRRAQRFVASRLFTYGSTVRNPVKIEDAQGESFMASRSGQTKEGFSFDDDAIKLLEEGGSVNTNDPMAIPIGRGRPFNGVFSTVPIWARTKSGLDGRNFSVVPNPRGGPALIIDERERSINKARREGNNEDLIVGIMVRRREQKPKLRFFAEFERIKSKHLAKYDKAAVMATTAAGRAALTRQQKSVMAGRAAFTKTFEGWLKNDPKDFKGARKAAETARRDARKRRTK